MWKRPFVTKCGVFAKKFFRINGLSKRSVASFSVNEEVRQALFEGEPVVALESTIITHGMKFPHNYQTATEVQDIIRKLKAVPATIAVLNGQIKVGLSQKDLEELSQNQGSCLKVSRRDFPYVVSQKLSGGTTVSGTMIIAHKMGIPIFVTGGIGGVHREGEQTMDISADLTELGRTPVAVISSGIKSILDIPKTLEYLETQGVAVATFGLSADFPAFYCRRSGLKSPYNIKSYKEAAEFIQSAFDLNFRSGILIGVPIPQEYSIDEDIVEDAINKGLIEAKEKNVTGKDVTPFLLRRVSDITDQKSLQSNIALIKNNALVGGKIAVALMNLRKNRKKDFSDFFDLGDNGGTERERNWQQEQKTKEDHFDVVVIGGSNFDVIVNIEEGSLKNSRRLLWLKMNKILKGIMKYRQTDRITMVQQFKEVKDDPHPKAVFFTCIDSRMIPTRFTETCVGDMFVVRNAGNVIPHSKYYPDEITTNEPAALELGCVMNNVRHVIVCGHSDCKAMNLLYSLRNEEFSSQTNRRISPLRAWMCAHASSSLERFLDMEKEGMQQPLVFHAESPLNKFVAYIDPENKFRTEDKLSQVNTLQQLQNIASYGFLRTRLERHDLHIHALWFDIYTGDIYYFSRASKQFVEMDGRTVRGKIRHSGGGVARNIADALGKLLVKPCLISAVGNEHFGNFILRGTVSHLSTEAVRRTKDANTGTCMVLCDNTGECLVVVGDMGIHQKITMAHVETYERVIIESSLVVLDGNLSQKTTEFVLRLCDENSIPVWFEPTDVSLASKPFLNKGVPPPTFISPNLQEFRKIFKTLRPEESDKAAPDIIEDCRIKGYLLAEVFENIIITLGKRGVMVIRRGKASDPFFSKGKERIYLKMGGPVSHRIYKPTEIKDDEIVNVSGAGDCFASGFIAAMLRGEDEKACAAFGFKCSTASLRCSDTVPKTF